MSSERTCLVIADIAGYTEYLSGVELDHAQDVLADLITTVVKAFRPRFKLAKLEGDAAFVYASAGDVDGSILMDSVEGAYFAFRQRLISIRQASTCQCRACVQIPSLDLKAVVHHGDVVTQTIADQTELMGTDVIALHRLLKNSVDSTAYALLTDATIEASALDPAALGMTRHVETYEHLGEVGGWVHDLHRAWVAMRERQRVYVGEREAGGVWSAFYAAPPELVWEYISSPVLRARWVVGLDRVDELDPTGRRQVGTVNHCMHGEDVIVQEFVDWRPPRYYTSRATTPDGMTIVATCEVEPVEGGSVLHERVQQPSSQEDREVLAALAPMFDEAHVIERAQLSALLAEAVAELDTEADPALPDFDERHRRTTSVTEGNG